jgi:hypothetical protein
MDFKNYEPKTKYPTSANLSKCHVCASGVGNIDKFCRSCGASLEEYRNEVRTKYKEDQRAYYQEQQVLLDKFWVDALAEVGLGECGDDAVLNITVRDLKRLAWELGHAEGLHNVYSNLSDFMEYITYRD